MKNIKTFRIISFLFVILLIIGCVTGEVSQPVVAKNYKPAVSIIQRSSSDKMSDLLIASKKLTSEKETEMKTEELRVDNVSPSIVITSNDVSRGINIIKNKKIITISGKAEDKSGIVEVLINSKEAEIDQNGNFTGDVFLVVGKNKILISAMDRFENRSTKQFYIVRKSTSVVSTPTEIKPSNTLKGWYSKQYAIIIGIDKYSNVNIDKLQNAVNDAKAVGGMFSKLGFQAIELYDVKATKKQIIKAFSSVLKKIQKNDNFVFYFAGHGQGFTLESGERVGYIIPSDADVDLVQKDIIEYDTEAIPLNTIKKYCKDMKAKHIALIFDSCFSGLAMKRSLATVVQMDSEYYNDLLSRKSINILTAGDDQPVSDGTGHSPFTRAIINGLDRQGLDINDRDGFATFNQLAVYVKEKVEKATGRRQRPQFDNLSMEDGDFIFKVR